MSRPAHAARRTRDTDRWHVAADSVHPFGGPPFVVMTLQRVDESGRRPRGEAIAIPLTLGEAHQMGLNLVEQVAALLTGQKRPWDDDPGRTPFASRGRRGAGRQPGASAVPADRRPPRDGYPRPRSVRPGDALDSGA
jgi:hypothetical protein